MADKDSMTAALEVADVLERHISAGRGDKALEIMAHMERLSGCNIMRENTVEFLQELIAELRLMAKEEAQGGAVCDGSQYS